MVTEFEYSNEPREYADARLLREKFLYKSCDEVDFLCQSILGKSQRSDQD